MPEDLKLVVGEEVTYEDLSYQVLPKEYTFYLLPNQSLGKVNIYYKNQLLCTKDILSVSFFISNDCMIVAGIFFMLAIYELYYQHKKR